MRPSPNRLRVRYGVEHKFALIHVFVLLQGRLRGMSDSRGGWYCHAMGGEDVG